MEQPDMTTMLSAYVGSLTVLLALDALWLGLVARRFYRDELGSLMLASPRFGIALLFYLVYAAAVVVLAVLPGIGRGPLWSVLARGAILGLAAYGTYNVTNLATLKNWPARMSLVDMGWGVIATAASAAGGYALADCFL
jgi:uncharacterized membrane protein